MIILYDNLITDSILTPSSEKLERPISNIKIPDNASQFCFIGNSGNIIIDLQSVELVKEFILSGTNLTPSFEIAKIQANTADEWVTPPYEADLEYYSNAWVGLKDINESYRYWRIVLQDSSVTDLCAGYCFLGDKLQMPGINPDVALSYNNTTERSFSKTRNVYSDIGVDYFSSGFTFPIISDDIIYYDGKPIATREDILVFWYSIKGAIPFIMIIWDNDRDKFPPILGILDQQQLAFQFNRVQQNYSLQINFVETK